MKAGMQLIIKPSSKVNIKQSYFLSENLVFKLLLVLAINTSLLVNAQENASLSQSDQDYNAVNLNDVASGSLLFQQADSQRFLQAPQLKTTVDISIKGIVANVKVKQKFTNTSNEWQHAIYAFPLPDNAAVNQLKITVGNRVIVGEVQEKKQARKTFNKAKQKGQKAALIEQHRANLFSTQVANIPPHEQIEVELNYFQQVKFQQVDSGQVNEKAGQFSLHFPMAITPRYQPNRTLNSTANSLPELIYQARSSTESTSSNNLATELARQNVNYNSAANQEGNQLIDLTIELSAGAELAHINSVNHALISTQQGQGNYRLTLKNQAMDKDFKLTWQYQQQALPQVLNFQQQYQDYKYGLLMVLPGLDETKITTSRELTFVLDTSGSMAGQSLEQAKQAFNYALKSLSKDDSFQLISFNSYPSKLFQTPVVANETNKQNAWRYVNQLKSNGGTEIKSALALALNEQNNINSSLNNEKLQQIVFLTDGAVGNEAEIFSYIAKNIGNKRLFTVGLGSAPNRYFMTKAAEIGRGSYQFISNHSELVTQMSSLFAKLSHPVLTDLTLNLNDPNGDLVTTPNPIPDIYQNEPLFLSYQIKGQQTDSLLSGIYKGNIWSLNIEGYQDVQQKYYSAESQSGLANPVFNSSVDSLIENSAENSAENSIPPLATLWARRKIADHYRQLMLYKDINAKKDIIALALNFQLVTAFTSLVAVEKQITRPQFQAAKAKQLNNKLPAGQKLPSTALNWQWQFYFALCLLFLSGVLMVIISVQQKLRQKLQKKVRQVRNAQH